MDWWWIWFPPGYTQPVVPSAVAEKEEVPKKKKEPGILKKARMELLAEGNRKAADHKIESSAAVPTGSQPAQLVQDILPVNAADVLGEAPAAFEDADIMQAQPTTASASGAKASPAISPGIVLRSQKKVRRQPTAKKPDQAANKLISTPALAALPTAARPSHPIQALTNSGLQPASILASPDIRKAGGKKPAQTAHKAAKSKLLKTRKSL